MGHRLPHVEFWRLFSQPFGAKGREDKQDFLLQILVLRMPKSLSPLVFFEIGTIASDFEPRRSITPVLTWRPSPSFGPSPAHDIPSLRRTHARNACEGLEWIDNLPVVE
jgi:hypothetical protein